MTTPRYDTDVLVVGGGPAGLATAIAARQAGFSTVVVDRRRPPIDKACGEGLMPDGLEKLRQLGIELDPRHRRDFNGIRYLDGGVVAEGRFPGVSGVGVRRPHLHQAMVRRAEQLDIPLAWGRRVTALGNLGVQTDSGPITARWIVGADGLRSRIRAWAGLAEPTVASHGSASEKFVKQRFSKQRFGIRRHFAMRPWTDCVEVYWADGCEAYVTPVAAEEVGVAILWSGRKAGFDLLMDSFPELAERLSQVPVVSRDRGMGPFDQRVKTVVRGRVALVGDASGYVDAITGEGLSLAFHQAEALVKAIESGDLRSYRRRHRRIGALPDAMTRLLLWVERRPALRRRVMRALAHEPALFSRILGVHCRALPVRSLGYQTAPRLLWRLVQP